MNDDVDIFNTDDNDINNNSKYFVSGPRTLVDTDNIHNTLLIT